MATTLFSQLQFRYPFRLYQKQILERLALSGEESARLHIVAPPGSGKTIVGLELIKRLGKKAVVFVPNTTIQLQWKKQLSLFLPEDQQQLIPELVSLSPTQLKSINIFTYQLLATPDQNNAFLDAAALQLWRQELFAARVVATEHEAEQRLATLLRQHKRAYSADLQKYRKRAKDRLLSRDQSAVHSLLHPNAQKLIENLVAAGVETIVLDEVHHMLDYWAITVNALALQIPEAHLIGLTATPPLSATTQQKEKYLSLMGDIDYQVPTPAVIKEGNLAPYQDLVYFAEPTRAEKDFIDSIQLQFEEFIKQISHEETFAHFTEQLLDEATETDTSWQRFFQNEPLIAIALVKYLLQSQQKLPNRVIVIPEMKRDIGLDDWAVLLKKYALEYLKLSDDPSKHLVLDRIRGVLKRFGMVLTEGGIRSHRSPTDLLFAYSEAKNDAVVEILRTELQSLGGELRAVVLTDFEKMSVSASKLVKNVLDPEAGGAVGVFKKIVHDAETTELEPILITGTTVLVDADELERILGAMRAWQKKHAYAFRLSSERTAFEKMHKIIGSGPDWRTSVYVRMVTDLFEAGVIRCIVGTRGLLGEGWNSLRANTLIDLTTATTSTTTNQIRGRALRLDPEWPRKLANIWYVVCVDTSYEKGDQDLQRLIKKHQHFYGISPEGKISKGLNHLDEFLALVLNHDGFKHLALSLLNKRMMERARAREEVYQRWRIGEPYENIELSGMSLRKSRVRFQTAFAVRETALEISKAAAQSVFGISLWFVQNAYELLRVPVLSALSLQLQQIGVLLFLVVIQVHAGLRIKHLYREVLTKIPVDAYVQDIASAVVFSLVQAGLIDSKIAITDISVSSTPSGRLHIEFKNVATESSRVINQALSEVFSPVTDQRYLISRTLNRLPLGVFSPLWWLGYSLLAVFGRVKPTYHPVPAILAANGKRARLFARHWKMIVGGGTLLYTRSKEGSDVLLRLRQENDHDFETMSYETWK